MMTIIDTITIAAIAITIITIRHSSNVYMYAHIQWEASSRFSWKI
jgi:hypothetical protein